MLNMTGMNQALWVREEEMGMVRRPKVNYSPIRLKRRNREQESNSGMKTYSVQ
jgi:hypothetical protein